VGTLAQQAHADNVTLYFQQFHIAVVLCQLRPHCFVQNPFDRLTHKRPPLGKRPDSFLPGRCMFS
jgi:hypothetical protein